ncbi:DHA2 family efflux MFS transporter permease subunit [Nonomuraea guangzhouensis]|uniref:DHA2 family efflux MFS transporter permease subunit n=1 Tax=Nonomuraea guangzhouensis TaxID=1291555 RepID=A0ABW4GQZ7_9ACTN|nr:DHA2 family efflux MFS transporter permease subunit [Nonomuraea guangzhouensis]
MIRLPLLLACGGSFLAFLDVTITNLAVPALAVDFGGVDLTSLSWVVTLYTIIFAALLAPAGRLADVLGRRRLFAVGVAVFTVASLLAALAPTFGLLLVARGAQAVGAAALMPASLAFVLADTPVARRASAIGLWSAAASVAAALGPALGGVLVDAFGWRSLFFVNVPAGVGLWVLALRMPAGVTTRKRLPDVIGTMLLTCGVALLVLGIAQGWTHGWTPACLLGATTAVVVSLVRSSRHAEPAVQITLWRVRAYAGANIVSVLFGVALYASLLLGVLFLTEVWHYSELQAGLAMTPGAIASAVVGLIVGRVARRPSPRTLTVIGALALAATSGALALWLPATPNFLGVWLPAGLIAGAGMGAVSVGVSSAAALSVPPASFAAGTGLNIAARQVGGALGVAVLVAMFAGHTPAGGVSDFARVYLVCAVAGLAAAVVGTRLTLATTSG